LGGGRRIEEAERNVVVKGTTEGEMIELHGYYYFDEGTDVSEVRNIVLILCV
jgi:hypothetical protein